MTLNSSTTNIIQPLKESWRFKDKKLIFIIKIILSYTEAITYHLDCIMKITIEGNIGSGKTSVLQKIFERKRIPIFLEPVDTDWKEGLSLFYSDPIRWGFTFNLAVLNSYAQYKDNKFKAIYERSPLTCRNVFAQLQYDNNSMSKYEFELFDDFYKRLAWEPDTVIYIRTPPEVCLERMNRRARECENNVPLTYLQSVHDKHEALFMSSNSKIKIIVIDGNQIAEKVYDDIIVALTNS